MRKTLFAASLLLIPGSAFAQDATAPTPSMPVEKPSLSDTVPTPRDATESNDGYRLAAISVGAVAGVVVANVLTGGLATPVLLAGSGGAFLGHGLGWAALSTGTAAVGAVAGGAAGDYLYEQ